MSDALCNGILFIVLLVAVCLSVPLLAGGGMRGGNGSGTVEVRRRPRHTFTNEELLSKEIQDIRNPADQQKLLNLRRSNKTVGKAEEVVEKAFNRK